MPTSYLLLVAYIVVFSFGLLLRFLNLRHLKRYGAIVPDGFEASVDKETLAKTSSYTLEQSRVGLVESMFYATWYYSHPPVVRRVARLKQAEDIQ